MIVTAVRAYRVRVRPTDPIRTGRGPVPERADLLVELVTDDGHSGWGNGSDSDTGHRRPRRRGAARARR